jgi:hypothetical protein
MFSEFDSIYLWFSKTFPSPRGRGEGGVGGGMRRARAGVASRQAPPPLAGGGGASLSIILKVFSSNDQDIPQIALNHEIGSVLSK